MAIEKELYDGYCLVSYRVNNVTVNNIPITLS